MSRWLAYLGKAGNQRRGIAGYIWIRVITTALVPRNLRAACRARRLLAQGPMGSVLLSEYDAADIPPAFWNLAEPQTVSRIHRLYVAAGAGCSLPTPFRHQAMPSSTTPDLAPSVAEVNRGPSAMPARRTPLSCCWARWARSVLSGLPEDSAEYREIRGIAREQAHALLNAGVDGLLIETVTSIRNLQPMLAGARDAADGMPVLVSFVVDDKGDLLGDGLNIEAAVLYAEKHGANSVGVNCCSLAAANAAVPRDGCIGDYSRHGASQRGRSGQTQDGPRMAREPRSFRARMHRMEACRCRNGGQLLWNHGNHYGSDGRGARYIKGQNRSHTGRFFIACMSSAAFAQMVNAGAGRLPSACCGYTPCVP